MGTGLTDIADRLTPSAPIELTYAAQPPAPGTKVTTLIGHKAASGDTAVDYAVHTMIQIGDPVQAQLEVDALAGTGSQIGLMAAAFVNANAAKGGPNYPGFRVVLLPNAELHFGPSGEAIMAIQGLRSDMIVSCYPAGDSVNKTTLANLIAQISGPDRDLQGQFGSFAMLGSLDAFSVASLYSIENRQIMVAYLQDTNTDLVTMMADTQLGANANLLINLASTAGIYPGALVTGAGIPAGTVVEQVFKSQVMISNNATAAAAQESIAFQNMVSQNAEIVAAAQAGALMASAFPYYPVQGVVVGGIVPPQKPADRILIDPQGTSEACLAAGLCPLYTRPDGTMAFIRSITTLTLAADNVTRITAYFDWQDVVTMFDFREVCFQITQAPPFNNNPGGQKASMQIAAKLKDEILAEAQLFEDQGAFQGVKTLAPMFQVLPSTTSRGRLDFKIPVNVIPGLMVIAGNIQAVAGLGDFTL